MYNSDMKVLIINGSHRDGNTDIAVDKIKQLLVQKCEVRVLVLRDIEMKMPDGCEACANGEICPNIKDSFSKEIEPAIRDYDIYIIASPTYSDCVTPLIKIFWDRIVSWCQEDRMYLKGKKLTVVTHGMEDLKHLDSVVNWVKGLCRWEEAIFGGALVFNSGAEPGNITIKDSEVKNFVQKLLK
jgi:multimeric flavodoxin WrbA